MEQYITFSQLNDFLYSPASLYLHGVYAGFAEYTHKAKPQVYGKLRHEVIDAGTYSTRKDVISGKYVWSDKFCIGGKIDIYDASEKHLIERKSRVKEIYEGYLMQIYAQVFAMRESGYVIEKISLHSLDDNKRYKIPLPTNNDEKRLYALLRLMRSTRAEYLTQTHTDVNGARSIYGQLSW